MSELSFARSALLALCALTVCALTAWEGVRVGADQTVPGAFARHRNALAVAISCLAYGHCHGYTSLQSVDQSLQDGGFSYGAISSSPTAYTDFLHNAGLINKALEQAASIPAPGVAVNSMGPHEKGLALFYELSMALFGIKLSSLFYGFMLIFSATIVLFTIAFYRDYLAMVTLVAACCAMYLAVPVVQGLSPDVNAVHSSRYLPLLAIVPTIHLLMLFERGKERPMQIALAAGQAGVLFLVMFSRLSGLWMLAGLVLWIAGRIAASMISRDWRSVRTITLRAIVPSALVGFVLAALIIYPKLALDPQYLKHDETEYRTFWHHLLLAANFNPSRQKVTGLPVHHPEFGDLPGHADMIAYLLFEKEIARRGENLSQYLNDDEAGWQQRTTHRRFDYKWGAYESVVKSLVLRLVAEHPLYVMKSLLFYEPVAIIAELFTGQFAPPVGALIVVAGAIATCALTLSGQVEVAGFAILSWAALMFFAMSLLPALASGVMPLRLVESAFLLYMGLTLLSILFLPRFFLAFPALVALARER